MSRQDDYSPDAYMMANAVFSAVGLRLIECLSQRGMNNNQVASFLMKYKMAAAHQILNPILRGALEGDMESAVAEFVENRWPTGSEWVASGNPAVDEVMEQVRGMMEVKR